MITNLMPDPDSLKQNNEVAKAELKKRLMSNMPPGPGEYDPKKNESFNAFNGDKIDAVSDFRKPKDKSLLSKIGLQDNLIGKKGLAFNSTSPRFQNQSEQSRNHGRARTLNADDLQKPVYEL